MKKRVLSIFLALVMVLALLPVSAFAASSLKAPTISITRSGGKPKITWSAVSKATKYYIYRSTDGKSFSKYSTTTNTYYTNTKASIGKTYYYKVKAASSSATSAYSSVKSIKCIPATPSVTAKLLNDQASLTWGSVSGASKYEIYRSTNGKDFKKYTTTTSTSYTDTKVSASKTYYYKVRALAVVSSKNVYSSFCSAKSVTVGNITWSLSDGVLTISGSGPMSDYDTYKYASPWNSSRSQIKSVVIGNGITRIGEYAFYFCSNITGVSIPNSVTSIGNDAFYCCYKLASITIPGSVTKIGDNAFYSCEKLTSITIPNGVKSIGAYAFIFCDGAESLTLPNTLTSIGEQAFASCHNLTNVTIPASVTSIGSGPFSNCDKLKSITVSADNAKYCSVDGVLFNKNKTTLVQYPSGKDATSYSIPSTVTKIGNYAMSHCDSLTSVTIPSKVTSIGDYAFWYCTGLTSITIPSSVTSIGEEAFSSCRGLTGVKIPGSVTSIGDYAFWYCSNLTSVTISNGVKTIGKGAFSNCKGITEITVPASVTSIGAKAFSSCDNLSAITVSSSNTKYCSVNGVVFNKDKTTLVQYPVGKTNTSYTVASTVKTIGESAFYGSKLSTVTIKTGVTAIKYAAFNYCSSLTTVNYTGTKTQWGKITIESGNNYLKNATINYNYK